MSNKRKLNAQKPPWGTLGRSITDSEPFGDWTPRDPRPPCPAPLWSGSYDEVVSSATLYAATLGRRASVGEIDTKDGFEDEDGFTECHQLEIEFLCPHGNGTDSLLYCRMGVAGQPMPQITGDTPWELDETGTEAWFDNCICPGVL